MDDLPPIPAEIMGDEPVSDEDLDAYLTGVDDSNLPAAIQGIERVRRFEITDDQLAEWALRKLAELDGQLAEKRALAHAWLAQITAWLDKVLAPLEHRRNFLADHLEQYAIRRRMERLAADPKDRAAKTLVLPSGTVSTTEARPKVKITDGDAVLDYLLRRAVQEGVDPVEAGWIRVKREPVADAVKKLATIKTVGGHEVVNLDLECGHALEIEGAEGFEPLVDECPECGTAQTVVHFERRIIPVAHRALVDGEIVPGLEAEGPSVTAKARPI